MKYIVEYIWIDSTQWFSRFQMAAGDRIQIRKLATLNPTTAETDLLNFLQNVNGLMIVDTAYARKDASGVVHLHDGNNTAGYSRFIIVRSKFNDPTTGSTTVLPFGDASTNTNLGNSIVRKSFLPGRLINLSHQTQLIFRIITREYDSTALVRPDNL